MSRLKAIMCSALFIVVIWGLFFVTTLFKGVGEDSLFFVATSAITGIWVAEKAIALYNWLRKKN